MARTGYLAVLTTGGKHSLESVGYGASAEQIDNQRDQKSTCHDQTNRPKHNQSLSHECDAGKSDGKK